MFTAHSNTVRPMPRDGLLLPDFIVIGAMKSGTTTIYRHLRDHPGIDMSRDKETDFFVAEKNWPKGLRWYSRQFSHPRRKRGEVSPNYAKCRDFPGVPARIAALCPRVRLIYIVRDPVARAVSQFRHGFIQGVFGAEVLREIGNSHEYAHIIDTSHYARQLDSYLAHFPQDAILILDFDDLITEPDKVMGRVAAHIGVTETSLDEAVEMVRIRLSIERGVARKIASSDISRHRPALEDLIEQMAEAHRQDDLYRGSELDRAFHCGLATAAGMDLLSPLLQRCALHIHRFTLGSVEVPREFFQEAGVDAEHRALLETLTGGDPDNAEQAISAHLAHVLERWTPSLYHAVGPSVFSELRKK